MIESGGLRWISELEHSKWTARRKTLRSLGRLDPEVLLHHGNAVTERLSDEAWQVRQAALEVLAKLQHLAISTQAIVLKLVDEHWQVRRSALQALANLTPETLPACAKAISRRLKDADWRVRLEALELLGKLERNSRADFAGTIAVLLADEHGGVRRAAVIVLRKMLLMELRLMAGAQEQMLPEQKQQQLDHEFRHDRPPEEDKVHEGEREDRGELMEREEQEEVELQDEQDNMGEGDEQVEDQVEPDTQLADEGAAASSSRGGEMSSQQCDAAETPRSSRMRRSAAVTAHIKMLKREVVRLLCACFNEGESASQNTILPSFSQRLQADLDSGLLVETFASVAEESVIDTLLHQASEHGCLLVVQNLVKHRQAWLHAKNSASNTPLHLAAREGHVDICKALVSAGALTKVGNNRKHTPGELASFNEHAAIVSFLESRQNLTTVRGGTGDALEEAMADDRQIMQVDWYKIALPGVAGRVGAIHSLLAITVGGQGESHTYVIEKAAITRVVAENDRDRVKNGVHVSHWLDVVPNVEHDPIHTLHACNIVNNTGTHELCMRILRDIAVDLGPYNVATCNCHHAALAVYNACSNEAVQVPRIPNSLLVFGARLLQGVGVDVATSESAASNSKSTSAASTSAASTSGAPTRDRLQNPGSSNHWDLEVCLH